MNIVLLVFLSNVSLLDVMLYPQQLLFAADTAEKHFSVVSSQTLEVKTCTAFSCSRINQIVAGPHEWVSFICLKKPCPESIIASRNRALCRDYHNKMAWPYVGVTPFYGGVCSDQIQYLIGTKFAIKHHKMYGDLWVADVPSRIESPVTLPERKKQNNESENVKDFFF